MKIKEFAGNFFEIGQQLGSIYKENGMDLDNIEINPEIYKRQLDIYKRYYPELLEEIVGIANTSKIDNEKLINYFITSELLQWKNQSNENKACTIFGFKKEDKLFVGRNYDWLPETEKFVEIYKYINPLKNSFIAITDKAHGGEAGEKANNLFYNVDDAINDKGLFIGLTYAHTNEWNYGLSSIHITKIISENCETVGEAIKMFDTIPLCCPKNFFIADKFGSMAVIEHTSKEFKVLRPEKDILIQTNNFIDSELIKKDTVLDEVPFHNTFIRYYETLQKIRFEENNFNQDSIEKILNQKYSYTCQNFPGVKTLWTLSLDMTSKKYKIFTNIFGNKKETILEI